MTINQVAALLQVNKATVYAWTHQDWIPHVKVGRLVQFRREAIEAWLKATEVKGRLTRVPAVEIGKARGQRKLSPPRRSASAACPGSFDDSATGS